MAETSTTHACFASLACLGSTCQDIIFLDFGLELRTPAVIKDTKRDVLGPAH